MGKKRTREEDHEGPIAKRINKLHIRQQPSCSTGHQSHNQGGPSNEGTTLTNVSSNGCQRLITPPRADQSRHCPADQMPHHLNENANNKQFHSAPSTSSNPPQRYSPELSRDENPHYYAINEQLYYFHQERMLRFQHQN